MSVITFPLELGNKSDLNTLNTVCFAYAVAQDLFNLPKEQYILPLQYTAIYNNLNIIKREDYEKSLCLLIDSIYNN
jgi:hypothetical protein